MKDRLLQLIDAQLGKFLLILALAWTGWSVSANWYHPLPSELTEVTPLPVYVELDAKAMSQAGTEVYYDASEPSHYTADTHVFKPEVTVTVFRQVDLDIPPVSVKRPPMILPDPGPSLEGADKMPRFGDELPPPTAADLPAPAVKTPPPVPKF